MTQELISKKTLYEFQEYFVGRTLREIEAEFDAADVPFDADHVPRISGARRSLVQKYYHAVDWTDWTDVRRVLVVYQNVLASLEQATPAGWDVQTAKRVHESLRKWIERDGFQYHKGKLVPVGEAGHLPQVQAVAARFDAPELHRQIDRMREAVDSDPALAIGTAKELIETTCKVILGQRGVTPDIGWDLPELVRRTRKVLGLLPEDVPQAAKGAETIRKLLGSLGAVAQGLGELRNLYGTGHGRDGAAKGLKRRHALLAVGAASTLVTFLFETHGERAE